MTPDASLLGRNTGMDFSGKDGWSMYHDTTVPGFPSRPHRGFETISIVEEGFVDHTDAEGAQARYGEGDTRWLTHRRRRVSRQSHTSRCSGLKTLRTSPALMTMATATRRMAV